MLEMKPPRNVKEGQQLSGKIVELSRFISRSTEKGFPFFQMLRQAPKFEWTEKCDQALAKLKEFLAELPLLTKPLTGEELFMYLAVGDIVISSVLIQEESGVQKPVYYVRRLLQGAELRYPKVKKAGLALIVAVRKLRPYFLSHKITVRIDLPLKQILEKPEMSGRMMK